MTQEQFAQAQDRANKAYDDTLKLTGDGIKAAVAYRESMAEFYKSLDRAECNTRRVMVQHADSRQEVDRAFFLTQLSAEHDAIVDGAQNWKHIKGDCSL